MNVLIVEDETHTARLLKELIEQDAEFIVVERLESVAETVLYLSRHQSKIDLMFLDIQLADGHSFEIFQHVDVSIPVVFCTAYDEYSLQAIKNNGIDYVLKPVKEADISIALSKFKKLSMIFRNKTIPSLQLQSNSRYQQSFLTQQRDKTLIQYVKDVALFSIEHEIVYMYISNGGKFPLFKNLDYIESVCNPQQFFRINRQMLVNRDAVVSLEPYFNRKMIVQTNVKIEEKLIVSRLKVSSFKQWLGG